MTSSSDVWLDGVQKSPSPNCDERPEDCDVDLLVLHNISLPPDKFGGGFIEAFFQNRLNPADHPYFEEINDLQVSAHLLILRDGSTIQFVPLNQRAWHAGQSTFCGRSRCNDFSVGIELEGSDDQEFSDQQYAALLEMIQKIRKRYPKITPSRITGHSDIAPGRKTDPGPHFDWQRLLTSL